MTKFLLGFGIGLTVGLLYAPLRGEDVRTMAAVRASEIADSARDTYQKAQESVTKAVESVRDTATGQRSGTQG